MPTAYLVVLEREDDGRFSVSVPDLPGCATWGENREEAIVNVREAIESYLGALVKLGRQAPAPRSEVEVVRVEAA